MRAINAVPGDQFSHFWVHYIVFSVINFPRETDKGQKIKWASNQPTSKFHTHQSAAQFLKFKLNFIKVCPVSLVIMTELQI